MYYCYSFWLSLQTWSSGSICGGGGKQNITTVGYYLCFEGGIKGNANLGNKNRRFHDSRGNFFPCLLSGPQIIY